MPSKSLVWGKKVTLCRRFIFLFSSTEGKIADINTSLQNNKHQVHWSELWITTNVWQAGRNLHIQALVTSTLLCLSCSLSDTSTLCGAKILYLHSAEFLCLLPKHCLLAIVSRPVQPSKGEWVWLHETRFQFSFAGCKHNSKPTSVTSSQCWIWPIVLQGTGCLFIHTCVY